MLIYDGLVKQYMLLGPFFEKGINNGKSSKRAESLRASPAH